MSQRGPFDPQALARRMPGGSLEHEGVVFDLVGDEPADVVFIQNYLRYDQKITAKRGYVWKWNNEPIVRKPIEHGIDRVYTHLHLPDNPEAHTAPPVLDWWVEKTFDELDGMEPPRKSGDLSVIASTKVDIPGHIQRHQFIARLEAEFPDVDIFGHGRARSLEDKWDGIAPYRYSIAIENTSKDDYWTEKIADCFLSYTVPLYFGATNISDYFPEDSYIWLPIDNPERAIEVVRHTLASASSTAIRSTLNWPPECEPRRTRFDWLPGTSVWFTGEGRNRVVGFGGWGLWETSAPEWSGDASACSETARPVSYELVSPGVVYSQRFPAQPGRVFRPATGK